MTSNLKSVKGMEEVVRIQKEVAEGRVAGPFAEPPVPTLHISPLGMVPKKLPGEFGLIHHLSYPASESVNDMISQELCKVRYTSFDAAIPMVRSRGTGADLAKAEIKSAFCLLPVHPADFKLLGFQFEGCFQMDKVMPIGCLVSCAAFEHFSSFLEWALMHRVGLSHVVHFLDDFCMCGKPGSGQCQFIIRAFQTLTRGLAVPLVEEKSEAPSIYITFLGIELNTVQQSSRLPDSKFSDLRIRIRNLLQRQCVILRGL